MTNGMRPIPRTEQQDRMLNRINRRIRWKTRWYRIKHCLAFPFVKLMPAKEIVVRYSYGGPFPACPRCGEMIYYYNMCIFCGQRLKMNTRTVGGMLDERER